MRSALITAVTVEVNCPHCGEPQPAPDNGSHVWVPSQVSKADGARHECVSCDKTFVIHAQRRVAVDA
jgi:transposase-like protein